MTKFADDGHAWNRPSIPVSGPVELRSNPLAGKELTDLLRIRHIAPTIGPASGLKCCFATVSKGFTALAIQSFTSASNLGVLPELKGELERTLPAMFNTAQSGVCAMPPKAYRWVREMQEIGQCHEEDGGFEGMNIFNSVAKIYEEVACNEVLGAEKIGERKRGRTIEDVAELMGKGLRKKAKKDV